MTAIYQRQGRRSKVFLPTGKEVAKLGEIKLKQIQQLNAAKTRY